MSVKWRQESLNILNFKGADIAYIRTREDKTVTYTFIIGDTTVRIADSVGHAMRMILSECMKRGYGD